MKTQSYADLIDIFTKYEFSYITTPKLKLGDVVLRKSNDHFILKPREVVAKSGTHVAYDDNTIELISDELVIVVTYKGPTTVVR